MEKRILTKQEKWWEKGKSSGLAHIKQESKLVIDDLRKSATKYSEWYDTGRLTKGLAIAERHHHRIWDLCENRILQSQDIDDSLTLESRDASEREELSMAFVSGCTLEIIHCLGYPRELSEC